MDVEYMDREIQRLKSELAAAKSIGGDGRMYVLEGLDAAGKATQTKMLAERLRALGREVHVFSFPRYATTVGKAIKRHLTGHIAMMREHSIDSSDHRIDGDTTWRTVDEDALAFQCLMLADKCSAANGIRTCLGLGQVVICDRWWQSALAFGKADGLDSGWLWDIHEGLPEATRNILIDVPMDEALRRRPEVRDRYEKDREKQAVVRQNYERMWAGGGSDYVRVDGVGTVDDVHARVWAVVDETLVGKRTLNYVMGAGRYQEAPWVALVDGCEPGRKFELFGRGATSAVVYYDGESRTGAAGWAFGLSWLGAQLRLGRIFPIDGTPE